MNVKDRALHNSRGHCSLRTPRPLGGATVVDVKVSWCGRLYLNALAGRASVRL